jgi:hypothetical protein
MWNFTLRYDTTTGQFIQNWKTPTGGGPCYSVTVTTADGARLPALFKTNEPAQLITSGTPPRKPRL